MGPPNDIRFSVLVLLIVSEWLLGFWLISKAYFRIARICVVVIFSGFFLYSSFLSISGAPSCNCFGHVRIPPLWTALFDLTVVGLFLVFPVGTIAKHHCDSRRLGIAGALPAMTAAFGVFWAIEAFGPEGLPNGSVAKPGSEIFLRPGEWIGQPFPLTPYLKDGIRVLHGEWTIILHKNNCSVCEDAVTKFYTFAYENEAQKKESLRFAVLTFPEKENSSSQPVDRSDGLVERMFVSRQYQWHAPTPTFVRLSNGRVMSSSVDFASLASDLRPRPVDSHRQIAWSGGMPDYQAIRTIQRQNAFACGPYALLAILESLNRRPNESAIRTMVAAAGEKGSDFAKLRELAETQGLHAMGVLATVEQLRQMAIPAIVHIDKCGFVAAIGYVADGVRIADPSGQMRIMPDDVFASRFGMVGRALLISDRPLPTLANAHSTKSAEMSNGLQTEKSMETLGVLHQLSWRKTIQVTNSSKQPITITESKVIRDRRNGCNNTVNINVDKSTLQAGENAVVHLSGTEQGCGGFTHFIVLSTQPKDASIVVPLHGYVEHSVGIKRPVFEARPVLSSEAAIVDVPIELPPNTSCELVHVDVLQGPNVTWKPISTDTGPVVRIEGRNLPFGINRALLSIRARADKEWVPTEVTVLMPIVEKIVLRPPSALFWFDGTANVQTRQLKITRHDGGPIEGVVEFPHQPEINCQIAASVNADKGVVALKCLPADSSADPMAGNVIPARIVFADGERQEFSIFVNYRRSTERSMPTLKKE